MKKRNFLWQAPLLLALLSPLWTPYVGDLLQPGTNLGAGNPKPRRDFAMENIVLRQQKDGEEELHLTAESLQSDKDQVNLELQQVKADLASSSGPVNISSLEAVYNNRQQILTLLGDVKVAMPDGYVLQTDVLRYLSKFSTIKTAADIEFNGENVHLTGTSMRYDIASGDFRVGSRVHFSLW